MIYIDTISQGRLLTEVRVIQLWRPSMLLRCKSLPRAASGHSVDTDADGSSKQRKQNRQPRNILVCPEMKLLAISLTGGNDS